MGFDDKSQFEQTLAYAKRNQIEKWGLTFIFRRWTRNLKSQIKSPCRILTGKGKECLNLLTLKQLFDKHLLSFQTNVISLV